MNKNKYANQMREGEPDIYPFEIVKQISSNKCIVRKMNYELRKGCNANTIEQDWVITSNPNAFEIEIELSNDGYWYDTYGNNYHISDKPTRYTNF